MTNVCCDTAGKKCYQSFIILFFFFILAFQIAMVALFKNSIDPDNIESFIDSETPLYNFEPTESELGNKKNITFFEFKGRKKKLEIIQLHMMKKVSLKFLIINFFMRQRIKTISNIKTSIV